MSWKMEFIKDNMAGRVDAVVFSIKAAITFLSAAEANEDAFGAAIG